MRPFYWLALVTIPGAILLPREIPPELYPVVETSKAATVRFVVPLGEFGASGGSGSIVSPDGYVFTNFHVTSGVRNLMINLDSGEEIPARIVGSNDKVDFSLVKLTPPEPRVFPYVKLGNSDLVKKMDRVYAIGAPGDRSASVLFSPGRVYREWQLVNTVTAGSVVDVHLPFTILNPEYGREMSPDYGKELSAMIATSATINAGNSGGPLFNFLGEQIGVNSWGASIFEASHIAMPINDAKKSYEDILSAGRVIYPWAGIYIFWSSARRKGATNLQTGGWGGRLGIPSAQEILAEYVATSIKMGLREYQKFLYPSEIKGVWPESPAEKAGLAPGDVILSVNGEKYRDAFELVRKIRAKKVGEPVEFLIKRGKFQALVTVILEEQPQSPAGAGGTL
ncbi:MAG: trypsin-like peptidase domain-containing protein [bacterium JZ-2024 1]